MNWEIRNLICDLKTLKEKLEDLRDNHGSHFEDLYLHELNHTLNKDDAIKEGFLYHEKRIRNDQIFDLLLLYIEKLDKLVMRFDVLERASSFADRGQDNA